MADLPPRYESVKDEMLEMCWARGKPAGVLDQCMKLATEFFDDQVRGSNPETAEWRLYSQDRRLWMIEQMTFAKTFPWREYQLKFPGVDPGDIRGYSAPVGQRQDRGSTQRGAPTNMGTLIQGTSRYQRPRPWAQGPPRVSPTTPQQALIPRQRGFFSRREDYDRDRNGRDRRENHYRSRNYDHRYRRGNDYRSESYERRLRHPSPIPLGAWERSGRPGGIHSNRPPSQPFIPPYEHREDTAPMQSSQANIKVEDKEDVFIKREHEEGPTTPQFSTKEPEGVEREDSGLKIKKK